MKTVKTSQMKWIAKHAKMKPGNVSTQANASMNHCSVMAMKTVKTSQMKKTAPFVEMVRSCAWMA